MTAMSLLAGLYPEDDLKAYLLRLLWGPEPGMRRVDVVGRAYECWVYEHHEWNRRQTLTDRTGALSWWLGGPWVPNHRFESGVLTDGADAADAGPGQNAADDRQAGWDASDRQAGWDAGRWEEAATPLALHIVMANGARA